MSYYIIIAASLIIIISYFFTLIEKKKSIPGVLMLISLGVILQLFSAPLGLENFDFSPILEILGIVGLIMIVLEASLDLELKRENLPLILKSFFLGLILLVLSTITFATIFISLLKMEMVAALLYAIPLSIISSAIVIPSVEGLSKEKKEFMIYESAFSDILGIMFFFLLIGSVHKETAGGVLLFIGGNILFTLLISAIVCYGLILLFQKIKSETKLFLFIAILMIIYSVGKKLELSSLIMIMFFGMILKNPKLFFRGPLARHLKPDVLSDIYKNFKVVTRESAFVVRTFFFVIFGLSLVLSSLFSFQVLLISMLLLIFLYGFRWLFTRIFLGKDMYPEAFISPRGLITILLFYAIPEEYLSAEFDEGILLFVILFTAVIMAVAMIRHSKKVEVEIPEALETEINKELENGRSNLNDQSIEKDMK
ncbi:MAG: cation:proton antiporter [Bacteroidales bacterium]|nr:cation:proton antiporter [Bacteroidales bacterium]